MNQKMLIPFLMSRIKQKLFNYCPDGTIGLNTYNWNDPGKPVTQWAAVSTYSSPIKAPPHFHCGVPVPPDA